LASEWFVSNAQCGAEGAMIKVGIVGGTGYTGVELMRLLARHPEVRVQTVTSRTEAGTSVATLFPNLRAEIDLEFELPDVAVLSDCDLVFFATPNGTSMRMAPELLDADVKVIDLAADFRLKSESEWQRWYDEPHACPGLLKEAVYGLPEINREQISGARLVANPGCYPTAVVLGLLPLVESGVISLKGLIADAKSGVSGAGRLPTVRNMLCESSDNFQAYATGGHRHHPEIRQTLSQLAGQETDILFVPHLVPMLRGIHATLYASATERDIDLQRIYSERYEGEPYVDVMPSGSHPETRSVRGSNLCRIAVHRPGDGEMIVVLSVIDNLVKGAAGQALQNMNLMFGFPETAGLNAVALSP